MVQTRENRHHSAKKESEPAQGQCNRPGTRWKPAGSGSRCAVLSTSLPPGNAASVRWAPPFVLSLEHAHRRAAERGAMGIFRGFSVAGCEPGRDALAGLRDPQTAQAQWS